jgi:hypothetical protein
MESSAQRAELDREALDREPFCYVTTVGRRAGDAADFVYRAAGERVLQRRS